MTKRLAILLAIVAAAFIFTVEGITTIALKEAKCATCIYTGACYDHGICGQGCVCFKEAGDYMGRCVSFQ